MVQKQNPNLTEREIEVIEQLATGKSAQEVADALELAKRTVDFHTANIFAKWGVKNRTQALNKWRELQA